MRTCVFVSLYSGVHNTVSLFQLLTSSHAPSWSVKHRVFRGNPHCATHLFSLSPTKIVVTLSNQGLINSGFMTAGSCFDPSYPPLDRLSEIGLNSVGIQNHRTKILSAISMRAICRNSGHAASFPAPFRSIATAVELSHIIATFCPCKCLLHYSNAWAIALNSDR